MSRAEHLEELTCLKHPAVKAEARCAQCVKPLCSACVITHDGEPYCSRQCAEKRKEFKHREKALAARQKTTERTSAVVWIQRGVIVFLAAAIGYYVFVYAEVRSVQGFMDMLKQMF